jgi:GNAT superfamily N-acetyltransferase
MCLSTVRPCLLFLSPLDANTILPSPFLLSLYLFPAADLSILVVDPDKQRTGAGGALLRWGLTRADEEGVICTLEATEGAFFDSLDSTEF